MDREGAGKFPIAIGSQYKPPLYLVVVPFGCNLRCKFWLGIIKLPTPSFGKKVVIIMALTLLSVPATLTDWGSQG